MATCSMRSLYVGTLCVRIRVKYIFDSSSRHSLHIYCIRYHTYTCNIIYFRVGRLLPSLTFSSCFLYLSGPLLLQGIRRLSLLLSLNGRNSGAERSGETIICCKACAALPKEASMQQIAREREEKDNSHLISLV